MKFHERHNWEVSPQEATVPAHPASERLGVPQTVIGWCFSRPVEFLTLVVRQVCWLLRSAAAMAVGEKAEGDRASTRKIVDARSNLEDVTFVIKSTLCRSLMLRLVRSLREAM